MRGIGFGTLLFLGCGAAFWLACTSDDATPNATGLDAGADTSRPGDGGGGGDAGPGDAAPTGCAADRGDDGLYKSLECAGLYASFATQTVAPDAKPYKPAVEFWSDGAEKARWVQLPAGATIDVSDPDEWTFPNGTRFWKQFKMGGKLVETRLYEKKPDGEWIRGTYRWSDDAKSATLLRGGAEVPGLGPDGGVYEIPKGAACDFCHGGRKEPVLGFDAVSLGLPGATGETLAALAAAGKLAPTPTVTALAVPAGPGGDRAAPALAWLHANCGHCHNQNVNAGASFIELKMLLRASQLALPDGGPGVPLTELDAYRTGYCKQGGRTEEDGTTPFKYIRGGAPERSLIPFMAGSRDPAGLILHPDQMPPIVSRAVDHAGVKLVRDWITALNPCP